jgi:hypothetical protein
LPTAGGRVGCIHPAAGASGNSSSRAAGDGYFPKGAAGDQCWKQRQQPGVPPAPGPPPAAAGDSWRHGGTSGRWWWERWGTCWPCSCCSSRSHPPYQQHWLHWSAQPGCYGSSGRGALATASLLQPPPPPAAEASRPAGPRNRLQQQPPWHAGLCSVWHAFSR